jgi:hypothetical protein
MKKIFLGIGFLFLGLLIFSSCPQEAASPPSSFSVRYHRNGGVGEPPSGGIYAPGETFPVAQNLTISKEAHYFSGWNTGADGKGETYAPNDIYSMGTADVTFYAQWEEGGTIDFWAQSVVTSAWYTIAAVKLAEGDHCIVYGDSLKNISKATAENIVKEYEEKIYPPMQRVFGDPPDIDSNGKVILFLLDILDGYNGGGYVAGYFSQYHMMSNTVYQNSNEADMLFLDIYPGEAGTDIFYATIAHELQHLIDFGKTTSRDLWINEGLSLSAEYLYGGQRSDRIEIYNYAQPYGLAIPYGNNFFVWNGYWENQGDSLSNYATAYLFFQWLRLQAKGTEIGDADGTGIYRAISDSSSYDYRGVTAAAAQINPVFADWPALLGSWMLANWYNSPTGIFGYREEIPLVRYALTPTNSGQSYNLYPGEGVFSKINGSASYVPTGNIKYRGVSEPAASDAPVDENIETLFQGSTQTGTYLLTFNGNTNKDGGDEEGRLGSVLAGSPGERSILSSGGGAAPPRGPYPIDLRDKLAGRGGPPKPVSFEEARTKGRR